MIKIRGLHKVYTSQTGDVTALKDVDLEIGRGEVYGIIGLSGAGKSTLIRCINLLEKPTAGSIEIDGQNITRLQGVELRNLRRSIGMIFQHFNLLMQRTVRDNVAFPLEIAGVSKDKIKERVEELLELVGLSEKMNSYPAQLSGGQKQRVAIARALANNPKVLLCDEATSALDPMTTKSILALLTDINRKLGLTIVIVTHEISVIKEICSKVAVIDPTGIVESGPVIEVLAHPKSQAAQRLLGSSIFQELHAHKFPRDPEQEYSLRVKVCFTGEAAVKPIVSMMVMQYGVYANILFGNIDFLQEAAFGELVLEVSGKKEAVLNAINYVREQKLHVEELSF